MTSSTYLNPNPNPNLNAHQPHLLAPVRKALAVLYSLPGRVPDSVSGAHSQAHEHLLQFQTRNVKRKLQSLSQRNNEPTVQHATHMLVEEADYGSTWMCCLALLSGVSSPQQSIHYAEALFAAQTLVHRLRRVKMVEAMDLEMEPPLLLSPMYSQQLFHRYLQWLKIWQHSNPNSMLPVDDLANNFDHATEDEERLKCEWTLETLASLMIEIALATHMRPLATTLASALAVTAARMRFTPNSVPHPAPNTQPIVTMIWHTFERIRAKLLHSTKPKLPVEDVYQWVLYTCLTVLPDALLAGSGSGGGAHGSISMDPRCYVAVTMEVRTNGMMQVCEALLQGCPQDQKLLFVLCQQWAKYAPIPRELLQSTIPPMRSQFCQPSDHQVLTSAIGFWIAIMDAGCWTIEEVLASTLIQKQDQQPNKKKQSNKAKKRQQEVLEERTTENHFLIAQQEVQHRQEMAFLLAKELAGVLRQLAMQELVSIQNTEDEVAGEGPIGGIVACANACLPYFVRASSSDLELFADIGTTIQEMCRSPSRMVRSFASETIYSLHEATMQVLAEGTIRNELAGALVDHIVNCSMSLALQCRYPPGYFDDLTASNDDELENERTDVRDLLRTCAGVASNEINCSSPSFEFASAILLRLIYACAEPLLSTENITDPRKLLFPETAIHAFSALSRPLIATAKADIDQSSTRKEMLSLSLNILYSAGQRLITAFPHVPLSDSLPLSRLYNLAMASLSPALSSLQSSSLQEDANAAMAIGIEAAMASLVYVPELVAPSSLRSSRCDIRGAMRTPGGEDHTGVLALMRLATHSEGLSVAFIRSRKNVTLDLCDLYSHLKLVEQERGRGILHGKGILPKSRRILLNLICHLEIGTNGAAGASHRLRAIFESVVKMIAALKAQQHASVDALFQITEYTFDLAAFSPDIVRTLFDSINTSTSSTACVDLLTTAGCLCYTHASNTLLPSDIVFEWNRLRAALFCLLKASGTNDLPSGALRPVVTSIHTECNAIINQCSLGPLSSSNVFREDLICDEVVPAGLFVHVIHHFLKNNSSGSMRDMPNCVTALCQCQRTVLDAVSSTCPNPLTNGSFHDPRPMLAEAWFLAILQLMKVLLTCPEFNQFEAICEEDADWSRAFQRLASETCSACVQLLLYPTLGKTQEERANDPGPSTDGPHMLVAMEFLETYFLLGSSMLRRVAEDLSKKVPVYFASAQPYANDTQAVGIGIIGAAIFRAVQGGLPPWAVECMPSIFSALYNSALCQNSDNFATVICISMQIRWKHDDRGDLISGRYFQSMGEKAKSAFVVQAMDIAKANTPASWKQMKSLIKQACGGKKKETDFRQRPGLTKLDALDRV